MCRKFIFVSVLYIVLLSEYYNGNKQSAGAILLCLVHTKSTMSVPEIQTSSDGISPLARKNVPYLPQILSCGILVRGSLSSSLDLE